MEGSPEVVAEADEVVDTEEVTGMREVVDMEVEEVEVEEGLKIEVVAVGTTMIDVVGACHSEAVTEVGAGNLAC
jgi:hypothetical protein